MSRLPAAFLLTAVFATAQDPRQIMQEAQRRQQSQSQHYEGTLEVISSGSRIATKRWVFDRLGVFGNSKGMLRFTVPAEVKGVGLLIVNHTDRASDQWLWRPNIGREQRIALQDRSTRFFGTDFSFEDLEERDVAQFDYKLLGDEKDTWKLESKPRKSSQYTYGYLWIRKDNYTIIKVESYNKNFELAKNIWTARTIEVTDVTRNSHTTLKYDKLDYNLPMKDDNFTLDALRRGP